MTQTRILSVMASKLSFARVAFLLSAMGAAGMAFYLPQAESFADRVNRPQAGKKPKAKKHNLVALEVFNGTLVKIQEEYVEPKRIDPKKMLYSALDSVQFKVPEVLVEPRETENKVVISVNNKKRTFSTAKVNAPWRLSQELRKIFQFIQANLSSDADLAEVEYAAVNGMLKTLDPHSVLLPPEAARDMEVSTSGKFGGLGIEIRMVKKKLTVIRPMKGTPASRAGLKRGDHIYKIEDELTENLTSNEAVERMRGEPKTPITIYVKRQGEAKLLKFRIIRDIIKLESVESRMLSPGVGYITIKHFSRTTSRELATAMAALSKKGAKGWVLDLRWNPGGLLDQAIYVSDLFVDLGVLVTTVDEGGKNKRPRSATKGNSDTQSPLVVLVNSNSASASEIVAGAMKNLGRGLVVGAPTFGKGSVQVLYDNRDGSKLKLTIGQYLTPGDRSIQSVGIVPDIQLQPMFVPEKIKSHKDQIRLTPTDRSYREKDLNAHLTSKFVDKPIKSKFTMNYLYKPDKRLKVLDDDEDRLPPLDRFRKDFEIEFAEQLLLSIPKARDRATLLKGAQSVIAKADAKQQQALESALGKVAIDWKSGTSNVSATQLSSKVTFSKGGKVEAGDILTVSAEVKNNGNTTANRILLRLKSTNPHLDEIEIPLGRIDAGKSLTKTTQIKIPTDERDRLDKVSLELTSDRKKVSTLKEKALRIRAAKRPVFAYSYQLVDQGNGDGIPQSGESHKLLVTIKNIGKGSAKEPSAVLRNASGDGLLLKKARAELKEIKPGQSSQVEFLFNVRKPKRPEIAMEMSVYDSKTHESVNEKLRFAMTSPVSFQKSERKLQTKVRATIRQAASSSAEIVGWLPTGTKLNLDAESGDWARVKLPGKRTGFVLLKETKRGAGASKKLTEHWQVTPPTVEVSASAYQTTKSHFQVLGIAKDDSKVRDVYIFVSNREAKIFNRKVFYRAGSGNSLKFDASVPLWDGSNRITVVARENDKVQSGYTLYVTKSKSPLAVAND